MGHASTELFTVAIPTLDRCVTLAHTLETCLAQDDEHFEILVSNNVSADATREVIEDARRRDERVRYIEPERRMSMSEHFEFLLEHVRDGFVMLLGSDDGLLPGCMPRMRQALARHPAAQVFHQGLSAGYQYPDVTMDAGALMLLVDRRSEVWNSAEMIRAVARAESAPWVLPYPYNFAWVRTSVLDELVALTGRRIHSPFPDLYLAVAIASRVEEYVHLWPPFGIIGVSGSSTGLAMTTPDGKADLERAFLDDAAVPLHPKIIYTRSTHILIIESFLQAIDCGLLPADMPIDTETLLALALQDPILQSRGEQEQSADRAQLREQARLLGIAEPDGAQRPVPLVNGVPCPVVAVDGHRLPLTTVNEAAIFAEALLPMLSEVSPDEMPAQVEQAVATRLRVLGLAPGLTYAWASAVSFAATDSPFVAQPEHVSGFEEILFDRAWTIGATAEIRLILPTSTTSSLLLDIDAEAFLHPPELPDQSVRVLVNDHQVGTWRFTPEQPTATAIMVPPTLIPASGQCIVTLEIGEPTSPASVGLNDDPRPLGLWVRSLRLTPAGARDLA